MPVFSAVSVYFENIQATDKWLRSQSLELNVASIFNSLKPPLSLVLNISLPEKVIVIEVDQSDYFDSDSYVVKVLAD